MTHSLKSTHVWHWDCPLKHELYRSLESLWSGGYIWERVCFQDLFQEGTLLSSLLSKRKEHCFGWGDSGTEIRPCSRKGGSQGWEGSAQVHRLLFLPLSLLELTCDMDLGSGLDPVPRLIYSVSSNSPEIFIDLWSWDNNLGIDINLL